MTEPLEGTNERLLGEVLREIAVACQAVGQPEDAVHVRVVQRTFRRSVAGETTGYELRIGHVAS